MVWNGELNIFGEAVRIKGDKDFIPFRYQGQYEDIETGLYYNRFRYYSPEEGMYISQDPIKLAGNNPTMYGYVYDPNLYVDVIGLGFFRGSKVDEEVDFSPKPNEYRIDKETGLVKDTHGVSVFDNTDSVSSKGFVPNEIDMDSVPETLQIKQRGKDPKHFEIMPKEPMPLDQYVEDLSKIKCK